MKPTLSYEQAHAFFSEVFYAEGRIPGTIEPYRLNGWALTVDDVIGGDLASYDYDALTRLVFMAHDRCVRVGIRTGQGGRLRITLQARERARPGGDAADQHPTIEEALGRWRKAHPALTPEQAKHLAAWRAAGEPIPAAPTKGRNGEEEP